MTINLLKRLESSVEAFRITLQKLKDNHTRTLEKIATYQEKRPRPRFCGCHGRLCGCGTRGGRVPGRRTMNPSAARSRSACPTWICRRWEHDLEADLNIITTPAGRDAESHPGGRHETATPQDAHRQQDRIAHQCRQSEGPHLHRLRGHRATTSTATLRPAFSKQHRPAHRPCHRLRSPKSTLSKGYDFQSLLTLFSPASKEKAHDPAGGTGRDRYPDRHRLHLRRAEPSGLRLPHQLRHPLEPGSHHPALRAD